MTVKCDYVVRAVFRLSLSTSIRSFVKRETARDCFDGYLKNPHVLYAVFANRNGVIYKEKHSAKPTP